jgi:hypothetical protein
LSSVPILSATEKIDLSRRQQVRFHLAVENRGTASGSGPATLVGRQKGAEIYRRTVTLSVPAGENKTVAFPAFTPRVKGEIAWTVTVTDQDGRPDTAKDKTEVTVEVHEEDEDSDLLWPTRGWRLTSTPTATRRAHEGLQA